MKQLFLFIISIMAVNFFVFGQKISDSSNKKTNKELVKRFLDMDLNQFVCKKGKVLIKDPEIKDFLDYTLINNGRGGKLNGFHLLYSDSFFLIVEVRGIIPITAKRRSKAWYFRQLCKRKVVAVKIPLNFILIGSNGNPGKRKTGLNP